MKGTFHSQPSAVDAIRKRSLRSGTPWRASSPRIAVLSVLLLLALCLAAPVAAAPVAQTPDHHPGAMFPSVIPLPNGFRPEGIVMGRGLTFYVGSLNNGAIYQGNIRTGEGQILVPGEEGRVSAGLDFDPRTGYLYVAGGPTGMAYVYDTQTGELVMSYQLTSAGFINDVVVTMTGAYFTNSTAPELYRLPLEPNGAVPPADAVETIPLSGEFAFEPGAFNANGIDAPPSGMFLIVVNTFFGTLYRVDPMTGVAQEIDLQGGSVPRGDGILLHGKTLYVVQNFLNQIAIVELQPDYLSGQISGTITDPDFRIPTSITKFGPWLYAVNARFDVEEPTPETEYEVVQVRKR